RRLGGPAPLAPGKKGCIEDRVLSMPETPAGQPAEGFVNCCYGCWRVPRLIGTSRRHLPAYLVRNEERCRQPPCQLAGQNAFAASRGPEHHYQQGLRVLSRVRAGQVEGACGERRLPCMLLLR